MPLADRIAVARLQHRLGFGPSGSEYTDAVALGAAATAGNLILAVNPLSDAADAAATPMPQLPYLSVPSFLTRAAYEQARLDQERTMKIWWLDRMVTTRQPLLERVTWFWHGHWATSEIKVRDPRLMLQQNATLRTNAFGSFTQMARLLLKDPAMLVWLDGQGNIKGHPNENLGREFLELFTLGVGNYTETDVREASRALTGWVIDFTAGSASVKASRFDNSAKTVLGKTANFDVDGLADFITTSPASANFIGRRIWKRLISETPPTDAQLQDLTAAFGSSRSIANLVQAVANTVAMSTDPLPWAKGPLDWFVSSMRALGLRPSELPAATINGVLSDLTTMGQLPFFPPNVSGWPAGRTWFSATSEQYRIKCAARIVTDAPASFKRVPTKQRAQVLADRLGVAQWSTPTLDALNDGSNSAREAIIVALNSPDYLVGA